MGEMADAMLDGTFCQYCGDFLDSDNGYPTSCASCEQEERKTNGITYTKGGSPRPSKIRCELCNKLVKKTGLKDHMRDKHNILQEIK